MNLEKVIFGFFVLLAATLNFGFFIGDISDPVVHNVYELFAAIVVSLIATVLKFGDRTQIGAVHLATSLVADLQLFAAGVVLDHMPTHISSTGVTAESTASVVSLSGGRCWPTWSRWCCWSSRPCRSTAGRTPMSNPLLVFWQQLFGLEDDRRQEREQVRRIRRHPPWVRSAGLGHDLPDHAADAGAADHPHPDLRRQRARPDHRCPARTPPETRRG